MRLIDYILEDTIVKYGENAKLVNPRFNQCIILAGGPGSGKGFAVNKYLDIDAKRFDVDELKKQYIEMQKKGLIRDEKDYDFARPEDVKDLHAKVKDRRWKEKTKENFKMGKDNTERLPNIIFDITSKDVRDIEEVIQYAKPMGYDITLVWVICNVIGALENNQNRDRKLPKDLVIDIHEQVYNTMFDVFENKYAEISEGINNAWIVKSTTKYREMPSGIAPVTQIKKNNDKFIFNSAIKRDINSYLSHPHPITKEPKGADITFDESDFDINPWWTR